MDRETLARLAQPLDLRVTRKLPDNAGPGKAGKLYLPGYEHTRTANQIFGWDWSDEVLEHGLAYIEQVEQPGKTQWSVGYWALVKVTAAGVTHTGMGFCDAMQKSKGDACSMAYVGAVTEGRKSALEQFGDRFGLGLKDATDQDGQKYVSELEVGASAPPPLPPAADPSPATAPRVSSPAPVTAPAQTAPAPTQTAPAAPAANSDEAVLRKKLDEATSLFWKATEAKLGKGYLPRAVVQAGIAKPADIRTFPMDRIPSLLDAVRAEWAEAGLKAA